MSCPPHRRVTAEDQIKLLQGLLEIEKEERLRVEDENKALRKTLKEKEDRLCALERELETQRSSNERSENALNAHLEALKLLVGEIARPTRDSAAKSSTEATQ